MKDRILGLQKNVFFLGLTSLFNDFSSEMVFAVFPAFFISVLKAGAASLGLVDGIAESISDFFKIYSGNLADRFQKRPIRINSHSISADSGSICMRSRNYASGSKNSCFRRGLPTNGAKHLEPPEWAVFSSLIGLLTVKNPC
jgi:hypothetical protein